MIGAGIGLMLTPNMGYTPEYARAAPRWAADTGCYSRGEQFDLGAYLAWLDVMKRAYLARHAGTS
jgi:hypothetical protein